MNNASYIASLEENERAVDLLKKIPLKDFSEDAHVLRYYYSELKSRYTKLEILDSASVYLEKMYAIPNLSYPEDKAEKNIFKAMIAMKKKKYKGALLYLEVAEKSSALQYVEQFHMIKFHKIKFLKIDKFKPVSNSVWN